MYKNTPFCIASLQPCCKQTLIILELFNKISFSGIIKLAAKSCCLKLRNIQKFFIPHTRHTIAHPYMRLILILILYVLRRFMFCLSILTKANRRPSKRWKGGERKGYRESNPLRWLYINKVSKILIRYIYRRQFGERYYWTTPWKFVSPRPQQYSLVQLVRLGYIFYHQAKALGNLRNRKTRAPKSNDAIVFRHKL